MFLFPYVQPENYRFHMDLRYHEDRVVLHELLQYERCEDGENLPTDQIHFDNPDGLVWNGYLPKTWEYEPPQRGNLSLLYICAPEFAETEFRLQMAAAFGNWNVDLHHLDREQTRIEWWMSLEETPAHMLEFAIYFLTVKTLEEGFLKLGVGPKFQNRLELCFRFLDRTREGTISWIEYKVLNDIWSEMFLGLEEFVFFLRCKVTAEKLAREKFLLKAQRPPVNSEWRQREIQRRATTVAGNLQSTVKTSLGTKIVITENAGLLRRDSLKEKDFSAGYAFFAGVGGGGGKEKVVDSEQPAQHGGSRGGAAAKTTAAAGTGNKKTVGFDAPSPTSAKSRRSSIKGTRSAGAHSNSRQNAADDINHDDDDEQNNQLAFGKTVSEFFRDTANDRPQDLLPAHDFCSGGGKKKAFALCGLEEVWQALDRDGGGSISEKEYIAAVKRYHYKRPNRTILYHLINSDGVGEIDRDEFLVGMERLTRKTLGHNLADQTERLGRKDGKVPVADKAGKKWESWLQAGKHGAASLYGILVGEEVKASVGADDDGALASPNKGGVGAGAASCYYDEAVTVEESLDEEGIEVDPVDQRKRNAEAERLLQDVDEEGQLDSGASLGSFSPRVVDDFYADVNEPTSPINEQLHSSSSAARSPINEFQGKLHGASRRDGIKRQTRSWIPALTADMFEDEFSGSSEDSDSEETESKDEGSSGSRSQS
eukprot:g6894.t1